MKALVTGGAGFIGSRLAQRLVDLGHKVAVLDIRKEESLGDVPVALADVRRPGEVTDVLRGMEGADVVYHLAGPVAETVRRQLYEAMDLQLSGTLSVLEAARRQKVPPKVVLASSFYVYAGMAADAVVNEQTALDLLSLEPFGAVKLMAERMVEAYADAYGLKYVVLRFGSAYGEGRCSNVVKTFLDAGFRGETVEVWGRGERSNQYTYVDDIVEGCVRAAELENVTVNLIAAEESKTSELAVLVKALYGFNNIVFNDDKPEGASMPYMVSRKAETALGWHSRSLEDGMRAMVAEMKSGEADLEGRA